MFSLPPLATCLPSRSAARIFLFQLLLVLLASIITKSLFDTVQTLVHDPTTIPQFLARVIPAQSTFFFTYVRHPRTHIRHPEALLQSSLDSRDHSTHSTFPALCTLCTLSTCRQQVLNSILVTSVLEVLQILQLIHCFFAFLSTLACAVARGVWRCLFGSRAQTASTTSAGQLLNDGEGEAGGGYSEGARSQYMLEIYAKSV